MADQPNGQRRRQPEKSTNLQGRRGAAASKYADREGATERAEVAEAQAQLSKENADDLQMKLTEHIAAAAESSARFDVMKARLDALEKTAAEADTRRTSSDGDSGGADESVSSKKLPPGMKTNLATHVQKIFRDIKFINDDTLEVHPAIMADACKAMDMKTALERSMYSNAAKRELKYLMSQKRAYCKKMVMKRYKGE